MKNELAVMAIKGGRYSNRSADRICRHSQNDCLDRQKPKTGKIKN